MLYTFTTFILAVKGSGTRTGTITKNGTRTFSKMFFFINHNFLIWNCNNTIENSLNGLNFYHIASIFVNFYMDILITKPRDQDRDQDRYQDQNWNRTRTRTNYRDRKWPGTGPRPIIGARNDQDRDWDWSQSRNRSWDSLRLVPGSFICLIFWGWGPERQIVR